jgi:hypothetical protein
LAEGDGPLPGLSTRVTLLAGIAELSEEIDVPRAERARDEAAQRVAELGSGRGGASDQVGSADAPDPALRVAEEALARAELRLSVAGSGE